MFEKKAMLAGQKFVGQVIRIKSLFFSVSQFYLY